MIGIVTDSNSQLPEELARRYGVEVVPQTVTVDGRDYLEGVDLDADAFYAFFEGRTPEVSTSQPSPGRFTDAYSRLVDRGVDEILSIHISRSLSGTLNSARIAASAVGVPVHLIDSGTFSFGISCCVWEAAEAVCAGASAAEVVRLAETLAPKVRNVFVVEGLDLVRRGGRVDVRMEPTKGAIPVLALEGTDLVALGEARSVEQATRLMGDAMLEGGDAIRVAVGIADSRATPFWQALEL